MSRRTGRITLALLISGASLLGVGIWSALGPAVAQADTRPKPAAAEAATRPEDQAAIRATMQSFVKAFGLKDAKALAAHWTSDGEYHNDQGISAHGRGALEKGFTQFFAKTPEIGAE